MGGDDTAEGLARPFGVILAVVVLVGLLGVGVSIARVASPATTDVAEADAILVHAANRQRLDAGLALARSGAAPVLVVSDIGSDYGRDDGFLEQLCARDEPVEVVCAVPEPTSTIGEARAFARLADERGWRSLAVVTSRGHLARARLADSQCTDAEVLPVAADPHATPGLREIRDEWLATVATATLWRACWSR